MLFTHKISQAIKFATKTHEVYQKQKRKGKDIPYITHPLTVGLILARAGADEDTVVAGILHDTIEDSIATKKVSKEMLIKKFGQSVAELVLSVTEENKELSWQERKQQALEHIQTFSHQSLLLKSADILANTNELIADHSKDGDQVFERFNAPKMPILEHLLRAITAIITRWPESPLASDLSYVSGQLQMMGGLEFMKERRAGIIDYKDYNENMPLVCPVCGWQGTPKSSGYINTDSDYCLDVSCPNCDKMLLVASYSPLK
jgi:hypothetical protein